MWESAIPFASGAAYGTTSVIVGQPWDTVKTLRQTSHANMGAVDIVKHLLKKEGMRGLYRGSLPPLIGGAIFRSAQFGCYEATMNHLKKNTEDHLLFGFLSWHVVVAGAMGGLGRGTIESLADHIKVRRQVQQSWNLRSLLLESGMGVTLTRNVGLFGSFVVYIDISKQLTDGEGLPPFLTGSLCATAAWMTIWPLDVLKTSMQSGLKPGQSTLSVMRGIVSNGHLFRGMGPGLMRSVIANGCSMEVYKRTEKVLRARYTPTPTDLR